MQSSYTTQCCVLPCSNIVRLGTAFCGLVQGRGRGGGGYEMSELNTEKVEFHSFIRHRRKRECAPGA